MTGEPATRTLGSTTVVFGWVEEPRVHEVLHASEGFQTLLAVSVALIGASAAAAIALAAGALHPIAMYLVLCALLAGTAISAIFAVREYRRYRDVKARLSTATVQVPVPLLLTTPGPPTFTVGGQTQVTAGPAQGITVSATGSGDEPSGEDVTADADDLEPNPDQSEDK